MRAGELLKQLQLIAESKPNVECAAWGSEFVTKPARCLSSCYAWANAVFSGGDGLFPCEQFETRLPSTGAESQCVTCEHRKGCHGAENGGAL